MGTGDPKDAGTGIVSRGMSVPRFTTRGATVGGDAPDSPLPSERALFGMGRGLPAILYTGQFPTQHAGMKREGGPDRWFVCVVEVSLECASQLLTVTVTSGSECHV